MLSLFNTHKYVLKMKKTSSEKIVEILKVLLKVRGQVPIKISVMSKA